MTEPLLSPPLRNDPSPGFTVRMPVLRRPPGWRALDEPALRARATQLYLACRLPSVAPAAGVVGVVLADQALPGAGVQVVADVVPAASRLSARQAHWHLLPWAVMVGGIILLTPWLIWAPVVGGLCLGLLLLQGGLVKYWITTRQLHLPVSGPGAASLPHERPLARESGPIGAVQEIESRRLKVADPGWLLTAVLVLVGVQAAILLTTVQLKSGEPAAVAGALRAVQAQRAAAARQGGEALPARQGAARQPDADQPAAPSDQTVGTRVAP